MTRALLRVLSGSAVVLFGSSALAQEAPPTPPPPELPRSTADGNAAPVVGLVDAVNRALARNPAAVVAYAEVRRAEALVLETRSSALPTLLANGTYTRLDGDRTLNGNTFIAANQLNANLLLTVPLVAPKPWAQWSHAQDSVD
jgi:outer membrane protein TolC